MSSASTANEQRLQQCEHPTVYATASPVAEDGVCVRLWHSAQRQLTWADVLALWADPAFARFFSDTISALPFEQLFWCCPPVSASTAATLPFEYVAIRAPPFRRADPRDFAEHFGGDQPTSTFVNLGGDAVLVAPWDSSASAAAREPFGNLAAFVR